MSFLHTMKYFLNEVWEGFFEVQETFVNFYNSIHNMFFRAKNTSILKFRFQILTIITTRNNSET